MIKNRIYDIIGIGIGPFNLGLAALCEPIKELKCLFIDEKKEFDWHPGLMLERARLQVPFYADLVTLADPCSRFSYLSFLKSKQRMFRFAILENNFILRKEYNDYCRWVADQLESLQFGYRCETIHFNDREKLYSVHAVNTCDQSIVVLNCKHLVIGIGSVPSIPECCHDHILRTSSDLPSANHPPEKSGQALQKGVVFHSSDYLYVKERLLTKRDITVVGSGQSAAEVFYDLLQCSEQLKNRINWFTRADKFFPMDYSKLALEMTSPDYIDHFFSIPVKHKKDILFNQSSLYKGINHELIDEIYSELYFQALGDPTKRISLHSNSELIEMNYADNQLQLVFHHSELESNFAHQTEAVILATGYRSSIPKFVDPIKELVQWDKDKNYQVGRNYSVDKHDCIFIQNAEIHTHGFNAPDLGMGPYRNATILNTIMGYEYFKLEMQIAFQKFGIPT